LLLPQPVKIAILTPAGNLADAPDRCGLKAHWEGRYEAQPLASAKFSGVQIVFAACVALICLGLSFNSFASLVAHYPFNGNANDESGNGYNGIAYGATLTTDRFGNPNSAFSFNETNNFIEASGSGLPTGARAVILWFDATTVANHPVLLGYGGGAWVRHSLSATIALR
jgi:hypothetical protein